MPGVHLSDVELEHFFHVHRDADENRVVAPVVARVRRYDRPDWTRANYRQPRYLSVLRSSQPLFQCSTEEVKVYVRYRLNSGEQFLCSILVTSCPTRSYEDARACLACLPGCDDDATRMLRGNCSRGI